MIVNDVMKKAMAVEKDVSLESARKLMIKHKISSLIVMENDTIKGIITEQDLLKNLGSDDKIFQIMNKKVITISSDESIEEAAHLMTEHHISVLPVIEEIKKSKHLIGVVSATDLIKKIDEGGDFVLE